MMIFDPIEQVDELYNKNIPIDTAPRKFRGKQPSNFEEQF